MSVKAAKKPKVLQSRCKHPSSRLRKIITAGVRYMQCKICGKIVARDEEARAY